MPFPPYVIQRTDAPQFFYGGTDPAGTPLWCARFLADGYADLREVKKLAQRLTAAGFRVRIV